MRRNAPSVLYQEPIQPIPGIGYSGSPGTFAGEVKAAIDAKYGGVSSGSSIAMPMSDAPLFELRLSGRRPGDGHADKVLPPRRQADRLLSIFWRYIHPMDYFVDEKRLCRLYEMLFEGRDLEIDERVFIATLNIVFAFAIQVRESIAAAERNEVARTYFERAWNLLRPESVLWEPPSLEVVGCLLLMSRYLQCTNNSHQAWMAVGSAIRIAQSLGIHLPTKSSEAGIPSDQAHWRQHLWNCCVFADMQVSLVGAGSHGDDVLSQHTARRSPPFRDDLIQTLELHEIVHHSVMAQTPVGGGLAERFGPHGSCQKKESYCNSVLQHEACLNQWEKVRLKEIPSEDGDDNETKMKRLSLQLRPMVARCCFMQNNAPVAADAQFESSYMGQMIQHGAFQCILNAQRMIALLDKDCNANESAYTIPWWSRIFYLHVAGTILLTAMQSTSLFTEAVSDSWQQTLSVFKKHEHLSQYIPQYTALFQSLARKASHMRYPPEHTGFMEELSDTQFHDTFLEFGFYNDNFLFDEPDETWFISFPAS
ncbi:hypothetical protein THAR02_02972 [Trichoderma harzianum]|uniref:Xylanolytic transcriptional activator regulatory domain-containing protein n=1 Tax=Trichoderma harzianum TaxID=5544 RepID=A0A0F9XJ87_TRIHA|nr:hypothetical protein THAR02_02972 [Trichoderma harzianum]